MVHQRNVGRVVKRGALRNKTLLVQDVFGVLVALFGQKHLVRFFVDGVVAGFGHTLAGSWVSLTLLTCQQWHDLVHRDVHLGMVFGLAANDERRARLIDQDRVHFIDNGEIKGALNPVSYFVHHVVAQVVESVLVVRAVSDIGVVGSLLFLPRHVGKIDADA